MKTATEKNKKGVAKNLSERLALLQQSRQQQIGNMNNAQQQLDNSKTAVIELNGRIAELNYLMKQLEIKPVLLDIPKKKSLKQIATKKVVEAKKEVVEAVKAVKAAEDVEEEAIPVAPTTR